MLGIVDVLMSVFTRQTIVVTGAGSGIGRGLTERFLNLGASVGAIDRDASALDRLQSDLKSERLAVAVADVTDAAGLALAVRRLEERLGPTDRLIANAGIGMATGFDSVNPDDFAAVIRVNLLGVVHSIAAVLPGMMARRRGHIVGLSSLASYRGLPLLGAYCASKSGVNALLDALAVEVAPFGIRVTTICPGWIRTPLTAPVASSTPGILDLDDALETLLRAIAERRRHVAFPRRSAWVVRLLGWLPPAWSDRIIARKFHRDRPDPTHIAGT
jgi:NAD(P)-dependent dehydrogenase (short-subunit alcohol dehydrogenase family)